MAEGPVAGRVTVAPLTLPWFVAFATFAWGTPDETTGGAAGPARRISGHGWPAARDAGHTGGCTPGRFFGETTGWPIALRRVGAVIVGAPAAWLRDKIPGLAVFTLGLMLRICCCATPRGGSTGGTTGASALIGASALLGAGLARLAPFLPVPFPPPPPLATLARAPWCAWPSLAEHGFAASAASTMLQMTSRKHISLSTLTYVPGCGGMFKGATGPAPSLRSRNNVISAGTTMSRTIGPITMPPTTTVASGRCT